MSKLGLSALMASTTLAVATLGTLATLGGCGAGGLFSRLSGGGGGGSGGLSVGGGSAWCRNLPEDSQANSVSDALSDDGTYDRIIPALAQTLCHPDEEASGKRKVLEAARQRWMATMQMTEADWASDVPAFAAIPFDERNAGHIARTVNGLAWSTLGPVDQYSLLAEISGEDNFNTASGVYHYIADALPLTEAGRVAYLERCITHDDPAPVEWAMCQGDLDALDRTKFGAELRADGHRKPAEKMWVRFALAKVEAALPAHVAAVKQLDATGAKLFAFAKGARAAWQVALADRSVALGLVASLDDARATGAKAAPAGCEAKARALFDGAVRGLGASKFENVSGDDDHAVSFTEMGLGIAVRDPDVYLAVNALVACQGTSDFLLDRMTTQLDRWPGARGPRTAALTAMRLSGLDAEYPEIDVRLPIGGKQTAAFAENTSGKGLVQAVKPKGGQVVVTMKHQSQLFDFCTQRVRTNRIYRIGYDGTLYFETACLKYESHRVDTTPGPFTIDAKYATAVGAGKYVRVAGNVVEGVWAAAGAPKPVAVWGIALK